MGCYIWHSTELNKVNAIPLKYPRVSLHVCQRGGQPWLMMVTCPWGAVCSPHIVPFVTSSHDCLAVFVCLLLTVHWLTRISFLTSRVWKGDMGCIPQGCQYIKGLRSKVALGRSSPLQAKRRGSLHGSLFYQLSMHVPISSMSVRSISTYMRGSEELRLHTYWGIYIRSKGRH